MKKRIISWLLVLCLLCTAVPFQVLASAVVDSGTFGDNIHWSLTEDGTLTISGQGEMPSNDFGRNAPWTDKISMINKLVIQEGVTVIGDFAFYNHSNVTSVEIANSVVEISSYAFGGNTSLTSITIPNKVAQIGAAAFAYCSNLREIRFTGNAPTIAADSFMYITAEAYYPAADKTWTPVIKENYGGSIGWNPYGPELKIEWDLSSDGVLTISGIGNMDNYQKPEDRPWNDQITQIKSVVIADGVTSVGACAFGLATNLESVTLPESVTIIGEGAFLYCTSLAAIDIPESVREIHGGAFSDCASLQSIELPSEIILLGMNAFAGCTSMTELTLPAALAHIEVPVAMGSGISNIHVAPENPSFTSVDGILFNKDMTALGFYPSAKTAQVYAVPEGVELLGYGAFASQQALRSVILPASVEAVAERAFAQMACIERITFKGNAPIFGADVFGGVTITVYYPAGNSTWTADVMQQYGGNVTWVAQNTEDVEVAGGTCGQQLTWVLTENGKLIISGQGTMTDFPKKGEPWRAYLNAITSVEITDGVTSIGNWAFYGYSGVTNISIPGSVNRIGQAALAGLGQMDKLVIPEGVTTIEMGAFQGSGMKEIVLPASLESIGMAVFINCPNLTFIRVAENSAHFSNDSNGFLYNKDQTKLLQVYGLANGSFEISSTVTTVGEVSVYFTPFLTEITVPASVTTIEQMAFAVSSIQKVTFEGNAPIFGADVFAGDTITAYYPVNNPTWTADVMQQYGGNITWVAHVGGEPVVAGGTCGQQLTWALTENGKLIISGQGEMEDYNNNEPWKPYRTMITAIEIADGVTSIGDYALYGCSNATEISIPGSVKRIGEGAMISLGVTGELVIPEGVVAIEASAFQGCRMTELVLPASLESIGLATCINCPNFSFIRVAENSTHFSNDSNGFLYNKDQTKLLQAMSIGPDSFNIPSTVTTIGEAALFFCANLTNVTIPASVTTIEQQALSVSNIREVIFEGNAPAFGPYVFAGNVITVYYPADNPTWTEDVMQQYEGTITWTPYTKVYDVIAEGTQTEVTPYEPLAVHIDAEYSETVAEEVEVYLNGELVDKENYTVTQGSVIVTFKPEYLATLKERNYSVTVKVDEGLALSTVTFPCDHVNKTEVAAKDPDCENGGNNHYFVCDTCDQAFQADGVTKTTVENETLAALGHSYSDNWSWNTQSHWHACANCSQKADLADHEFDAEGSKCAVCEYDKDAFLPGDVTGDGKVDIKDYSRILSHVKKLNPFTDPQILSCADVTGDGKVDIKDYSRVLAHCKKLNPLF